MKLGQLFYSLCNDDNDILFSGDYGIATNIGGDKYLFLYSHHLQTYTSEMLGHNGKKIYFEPLFSLVRDFLSHPTEEKAYDLELKYPSIWYSIPKEQNCLVPFVLTKQNYEKAIEEMEQVTTNTIENLLSEPYTYTNYPKEQYAILYDTFCRRYSPISHRMEKISFSSPFE